MQLADLWTDSLEPAAYVTFLNQTLESLTQVSPSGRVEWASDRQVIHSYFSRVRAGSGGVQALAAGVKRHMVLALWQSEIQKDSIMQAIKRAQQARAHEQA